MNSLQRSKIPAGVVQNMQEVFESPHAKELLLKKGDASGVRTYVGSSDREISSHFLPPPHFAEHTVEVLQKWLKLDSQSIKNLISNGSVV
jgi:crotonobetainyl-CoA:carnitine CoA-transferase CaiB-like acyl-CoA transferase